MITHNAFVYIPDTTKPYTHQGVTRYQYRDRRMFEDDVAEFKIFITIKEEEDEV